MSWSYSPGLVEEFLEANLSDPGLSALLNTTHTPDQYYWPDKPTEHSRISRFGMTCAPLMVVRGEELLTWYLAGSHAKTLASLEAEPDWTASGQGYGQKWQGSLGKYNPDTHSLKTAQLLLLEDSTGCCVTLPRWGLMLDGELYPQPMLEPFTAENESGYWPTPTTQDNVQIRGIGAAENHKHRGTTLGGAVMMWPTPTCDSATDRSSRYSQGGMPLTMAVKMFPTPQASDNRDRGNLSTPAIARRVEKGKQVMLSMCVSSENGRLNPRWVEWLMGWPIGHTSLKPLATDKYQEFAQQHGPYYTDKERAA